MKNEKRVTSEKLFDIGRILKLPLTEKIELISIDKNPLGDIEKIVDNFIKNHEKEISERYETRENEEDILKHKGIKEYPDGAW